jgi:hypothetical protein
MKIVPSKISSPSKNLVAQKGFLKDWGVSFLASVGVVSSFFAFMPVSLTLVYSGLIFVCCLVASGLFARRRTMKHQLPLDEAGPIGKIPRCKLVCPAGRRLAEEASHLAHEVFGNLGTISAERYESWLMKNQNILACLVDSEGEVVGYFDVLPLRSEFMDGFIRGTLTELDIRHEDILPPQHAKRCKRLYIAGIVVRDSNSFTAHRHAKHLMWGLLQYLNHFYGAPSERQVYASGGTKEGRQILKRFGFQLVQEASVRRDKQALFVVSMSNAEIVENVAADLGNWADACGLSWEERKRGSVQMLA